MAVPIPKDFPIFKHYAPEKVALDSSFLGSCVLRNVCPVHSDLVFYLEQVMKSIEDGYRLPPPVDCPSVLYEIMKVCWSYDRTRRPRFREIFAQLEHFISSPHLLRTVADFDPR